MGTSGQSSGFLQIESLSRWTISSLKFGKLTRKGKNQKPSHQTMQTRRREFKDFSLFQLSFSLFPFDLVKDEITGLKWNETTEYLASCSYDGWIKVIILLTRC